MTPDQRDKLRRLARCTMLPGSWDKRFVNSLAGADDSVELSEKQAAMVEKLAHKYRRQLGRQAGARA